MKRKSSLPELLCPAGDMQALYAAVEGGADAVYIGGKSFGARAFAKNFSDEEIVSAIRYCHLHGVKLYVTVNTLVFDRELRALSDYAAFLYESGADALIVADLGAIRLIRDRVPELELHASTQMSVHNTEGADAAVKLGCKRAVVARELPIGDICEIVKESKAEIEVFLHGALCVCHSGQCLFSSLVGGRSGNRGECAQPCRLPYNGKHPLSLRDLSLANHITELIDSGAASLKIEGRMKSADYVFEVASIYRRLLDEGRNASSAEMEKLAKIFSRGASFTDSYFTGRADEPMIGTRSETDKAQSKELSGRAFQPIKKTVRAEAIFRVGSPCKMMLTDGDKSIFVTGDTVGEAISAPLTEQELAQRLSKMGNTFLCLSEEDVKIELDKRANLSFGAVNALRRAAVEAFCSENRKSASEYREIPTRVEKNTRFRSALFLDEKALLSVENRALSGFDAIFAPLFASDEIFDTANGVYLPPVLRNCDMPMVQSRLLQLKKNGVSYALIENIGSFGLALDAGLLPICDFRMNITNSHTKATLEELGAERFILSAELDVPKARDIGGGAIVYGRIPLMITERCFIKENFSCSGCKKSAFTDRRGKHFPLMREYEHRNLILNSEITYMADKMQDIRRAGLSEHFIFSVESSDQILSVIGAYKTGQPIEAIFRTERPRRIGMRQKDKK